MHSAAPLPSLSSPISAFLPTQTSWPAQFSLFDPLASVARDGPIAVASRAIARIPHLAGFLERRPLLAWQDREAAAAMVGWGIRPSAQRAAAAAAAFRVPCWRLEDGFYRSIGIGKSGAPPVSLVLDDIGIYYDACGPSRLEHL